MCAHLFFLFVALTQPSAFIALTCLDGAVSPCDAAGEELQTGCGTALVRPKDAWSRALVRPKGRMVAVALCVDTTHRQAVLTCFVPSKYASSASLVDWSLYKAKYTDLKATIVSGHGPLRMGNSRCHGPLSTGNTRWGLCPNGYG